MSTALLTLIGIIAGVVIVVSLLLYLVIKSMYKVAEPNEAFIITGVGKKDNKDFRIVSGKGAFVFPIFQTCRSLKLNLYTVEPAVNCPTKQGIQVTVKGVVIFKIGDDDASIANAARRFLGIPEESIKKQISEVFSGHLRSIVGGMTVEEMIQDREALTTQTREASAVELTKLGLVIDSLQIQDIGDPSGYIENIAAPHLAAVKSRARIAQAEADKSANDTEQTSRLAIAESRQVTDLKVADMKAIVDAKNAEAAQQGPLAEATAQQKVLEQRALLASREAEVKEQELNSTVRKVADAEAYRLKTTAEAQREAAISQANGEAESTRLKGNAKADADRAEGNARADVAKALGEAEGAALKAKAEGMEKGQDAVLAQIRAEQMPELVAAAAQAYANVGSLTVFDGADGMQRGMMAILSTAGQAWEAIKSAPEALVSTASGGSNE